MTTIAYDGKRLVADGKMTLSGSIVSTTFKKLTRLKDGRMMAFTGTPVHQAPFAKWLNGEAEKAPTGDFSIMLVELDGSLKIYEDGEYYLDAVAPYACGSGGLIARVAMLCGKDAQEAVEIASAIDIYSGGQICSMALKTFTAEKVLAPNTAGLR